MFSPEVENNIIWNDCYGNYYTCLYLLANKLHACRIHDHDHDEVSTSTVIVWG